MAYCEPADLLKAMAREILEQLAVDDENTQLEDETPQAVLTEAIAKGDERVNAALITRYTTPLTDDPVPEGVRRLSVEAALVELFKRRPATLSDPDKYRWQELDKELERIRMGEQQVSGLTQTKGLPYTTASEAFASALLFRKDPFTGHDPFQ